MKINAVIWRKGWDQYSNIIPKMIRDDCWRPDIDFDPQTWAVIWCPTIRLFYAD